MGGIHSKYFQRFKKTLISGFIAFQKDYKKLIILIEIMLSLHKNM